ncbi:hypothetical protein AVEN_226657-1 [Araneus ventricosus]|uniref:Uncharacterized protein n=1 Tax=Araneus ventricosus TaxID=182803 RepID=A0A4Y2J363_ARAVE|nr:hypothetical protein AVEN_226657-1 [Araneus ventricosus]
MQSETALEITKSLVADYDSSSEEDEPVNSKPRQFVVEEIGEILPTKATILKSKEYLEDPDFVASILITAVADRKQKEEDRKIREEEEKKRQEEKERLQEQRQHELELARLQFQTVKADQSETQVFVQEAIGVKKRFHLPKLEFCQFSGNVKDWLPFWSQFEHIHKDADIAPENKFQYLVQATVSGSRAREVVESFPPTGANYGKAVESLKARFGKQDLLVEVYVRELLKLIISVQRNEKFSMTSLYDKLESYLRVLETLGVTTDKCVSILYTMVESCFPEEFLGAWNRCPSSSSSVDATERLTNLMNFFRTEVEGEERINLAMTGFGLNEKSSTQTFKKKQWHNGCNKISTAANLLTTSAKDSKQSCVFCTGTHSSADCFSAQKMSLVDRLNILKEKNCCFVGHSIRKCRIF